MKINETLGENVATATHRLRIDIIFDLASRLKLTHCYKCDNPIESARDLSIDHKEPWRGVSKELFWDLDNIAFTHKWCNKVDRPTRKIGPKGTSWCSKHKEFLPEDRFGKCSKRWNGLSTECLECDAKRQRKYSERNPRHHCPKCWTLMRKKCGTCGYDMPMKDYMALRRKEGVEY